MTLGEKLLRARQEAGLSQRQLCGDQITRNMLSRIENGSARPSMDTLRYLATRLEKPVSYFLEEDAAVSSNQTLMVRVRASVQAGQMQNALELLDQFRRPDPVLEWEYRYLHAVCTLSAAREGLEQGKTNYARQLLEAEMPFPELEHSRLLLLGRTDTAAEVVKKLPSLDEELLLRARAALEEGRGERAACLLSAVEDRTMPQWHFLMGKCRMLGRDYKGAAEFLLKVEDSFQDESRKLLEICFRELGDYKQAYEYACRQR